MRAKLWCLSSSRTRATASWRQWSSMCWIPSTPNCSGRREPDLTTASQFPSNCHQVRTAPLLRAPLTGLRQISLMSSSFSRSFERGPLRVLSAEYRHASETKGNPHLYSEGEKLPYTHMLFCMFLVLMCVLIIFWCSRTNPPLMRNWTSNCTLHARHTWSPLPVTGEQLITTLSNHSYMERCIYDSYSLSYISLVLCSDSCHTCGVPGQKWPGFKKLVINH